MTTLNVTNFILDVADDVLASGSTPRPQRPVQTRDQRQVLERTNR